MLRKIDTIKIQEQQRKKFNTFLSKENFSEEVIRKLYKHFVLDREYMELVFFFDSINY
jgi:hypothetical protein